MKTISKRLLVAGACLAFILFFACNKENSGSSPVVPAGKTQLSVILLDGPGPFTKVLLDIQQVAVRVDTAAHQGDLDSTHQWDDHYRGCHNSNTTIWDTLSITPGIYDLIKLRNGVDTLLAQGFIPNGKILKVRVTLGTRDTVYLADSVTHFPLHIFGPWNFFDINVSRENVSQITNNQFKLWLDFNLDRSIVYYNNTYWLRPELRPFNDNLTAKIEGRVLPGGAAGFVRIYNSSDTLYALPNWDGYFRVRGAKAGTYSAYFLGQHGYQDSTLSNISVSGTGVTTIPTVTLHK